MARLFRLHITGMISDTQSFKVTRDNIGVKTRHAEGPVSVRYSLGCDGEEGGEERGVGDGFFNEDGLMCTFHMRTLDAV